MKFSDYEKKRKTEKLDVSSQKAIKSLLGKFEGKSEDEIVAAIMATAEKNRKEGKLSDAEIDAFYSMLSPMLGDDKRAKLDGVVKKIKAIKVD